MFLVFDGGPIYPYSVAESSFLDIVLTGKVKLIRNSKKNIDL